MTNVTDAGTRVRVSFGTRDDDDMPIGWAERGLTWLHDNRPGVFGDMMLAIMNIDIPRRGRPRNANGHQEAR